MKKELTKEQLDTEILKTLKNIEHHSKFTKMNLQFFFYLFVIGVGVGLFVANATFH